MEQRVDLVPELLAADLCSLHAHVDRLAISVIWQLDAEAKQLGPPRFERWRTRYNPHPHPHPHPHPRPKQLAHPLEPSP